MGNGREELKADASPRDSDVNDGFRVLFCFPRRQDALRLTQKISGNHVEKWTGIVIHTHPPVTFWMRVLQLSVPTRICPATVAHNAHHRVKAQRGWGLQAPSHRASDCDPWGRWSSGFRPFSEFEQRGFGGAARGLDFSKFR